LPISPLRFPQNGRKSDFSGDFPRPDLTIWESFGAGTFQAILIPNDLKIICKVSRIIYTPSGIGG
jgi:hypothetical protein